MKEVADRGNYLANSSSNFIDLPTLQTSKFCVLLFV